MLVQHLDHSGSALSFFIFGCKGFSDLSKWEFSGLLIHLAQTEHTLYSRIKQHGSSTTDHRCRYSTLTIQKVPCIFIVECKLFLHWSRWRLSGQGREVGQSEDTLYSQIIIHGSSWIAKVLFKQRAYYMWQSVGNIPCGKITLSKLAHNKF